MTKTTVTSTTYQVTGMTCEHCVRAVTGELETVPGVSTVAITLVPGGESAVTVTSDAPLATEAVESALDEAGAYHLAGSGGTPNLTAPARTLPLV